MKKVLNPLFILVIGTVSILSMIFLPLVISTVLLSVLCILIVIDGIMSIKELICISRKNKTFMETFKDMCNGL